MERFYVGVGRGVITPKIGCQLYGYSPNIFSDGVEDDLAATAFYFSQGDQKALMVSVEVCLLADQLADRLRELAAEAAGISKASCMICATHTHTGPSTGGEEGWGPIDSDYVDNILIPGILEAVKTAKESAVPAKMGMGCGDSLIGVNRREFTGENTIKLGQNPWGCMNPRMTVIAFRDDGDTPLGNIIHYGCHGTAAGQSTRISRDWPGIMTDTLERESGAITAFFNGPEGDVGPRLSNGKTTGGGDIRYVYELGHAAALDAVKIYRLISGFHEEVSLRAGSGTVNIPVKKRISREAAQALREMYQGHTVNLKGMIRAYSEEVLASYDQGYEDRESVPMEQAVIRIGDAVFAAFPYEVFSEIGMRIDRDFPAGKVLSLSNTNGSGGYFITQDQICRGGYEVSMFQYGHIQPYCDDADWALIRGSVENIERILKSEGGK